MCRRTNTPKYRKPVSFLERLSCVTGEFVYEKVRNIKSKLEFFCAFIWPSLCHCPHHHTTHPFRAICCSCFQIHLHFLCACVCRVKRIYERNPFTGTENIKTWLEKYQQKNKKTRSSKSMKLPKMMCISVGKC